VRIIENKKRESPFDWRKKMIHVEVSSWLRLIFNTGRENCPRIGLLAVATRTYSIYLFNTKLLLVHNKI
jgi:hypothetical protein